MNDVSESGLQIISGEIIQFSASIAQGDVENSNTGRMYPFVMIRSDGGEVIKINNLIADAHIEQHLVIGKKVRFYLKQMRHLTNFKTMNWGLAAVSDNGTGILDLPARVIRGFYAQAIFLGLVGGAVASFLLTTVIGGVFYYAGITIGTITGLYFLENLVFVGGFLGLMSGPALLIYLLRNAGKFAEIRKAAERLRKKLGNDYRGVAVKNI
ncbi:hypothetical protein [Brucella pituitosa]